MDFHYVWVFKKSHYISIGFIFRTWQRICFFFFSLSTNSQSTVSHWKPSIQYKQFQFSCFLEGQPRAILGKWKEKVYFWKNEYILILINIFLSYVSIYLHRYRYRYKHHLAWVTLTYVYKPALHFILDQDEIFILFFFLPSPNVIFYL